MKTRVSWISTLNLNELRLPNWKLNLLEYSNELSRYYVAVSKCKIKVFSNAEPNIILSTIQLGGSEQEDEINNLILRKVGDLEYLVSVTDKGFVYLVTIASLYAPYLVFQNNSISTWGVDLHSSGLLAYSDNSFTISIRSLAEPEKVKVLKGHDHNIPSLCYNSLGDLLCSASIDESVVIWDVTSGAVLKRLRMGTASWTWCWRALFVNIEDLERCEEYVSSVPIETLYTTAEDNDDDAARSIKSSSSFGKSSIVSSLSDCREQEDTFNIEQDPTHFDDTIHKVEVDAVDEEEEELEQFYDTEDQDEDLGDIVLNSESEDSENGGFITHSSILIIGTIMQLLCAGLEEDKLELLLKLDDAFLLNSTHFYSGMNVPSGQVHPYTGVFEGSDTMLVRLSLAKEPDSGDAIVPGTAFKFFRDETESANFLAAFHLTGQPGYKFFANNFSTHYQIDASAPKVLVDHFMTASKWPTHVGLSHLATKGTDGIEVSYSVFPFQLVLQPNPAIATSEKNNGVFVFDQVIENTKGGVDLYDVWATEKPNAPFIKIGTITTTTDFVRSEYGDTSLFFKHQRFEEDMALNPQWAKQGCSDVLHCPTCHYTKTCVFQKPRDIYRQKE